MNDEDRLFYEDYEDYTVYEGGGGPIFIWSDRMMQCFPLFRIAGVSLHVFLGCVHLKIAR